MRKLKSNQIATRNAKGEIIVCTVKFVGKKGNGDFDSWQHNKVTVRNVATKKSCQFDFWGSKVKPHMDNRDGAVNALDCFAMDSLSVQDHDFRSFCSEFGYDEDSRTAEKVFKGCLRMEEKFERVIGETDDYFTDFGNYSAQELIDDGKCFVEY